MSSVRPRVIQKFRYVLVRCRKMKGLTQEQLSERAGISLSFLGMLESGRRHPNIAMLFRLASALDVRPSALIAELEREVDSP